MELVWLHSQFQEYILTHSYLHGAGVAALIVSGVCFDSFIFAYVLTHSYLHGAGAVCCTHSFWSMF